MQFLEVLKKIRNCQVTDSSPARLEKSYFNFALNVFFEKELKGAILSQNHRRSQGVGLGGQGLLNRNTNNDKNFTKKPCFFIFSFF